MIMFVGSLEFCRDKQTNEQKEYSNPQLRLCGRGLINCGTLHNISLIYPNTTQHSSIITRLNFIFSINHCDNKMKIIHFACIFRILNVKWMCGKPKFALLIFMACRAIPMIAFRWVRTIYIFLCHLHEYIYVVYVVKEVNWSINGRGA